MTAKRCRYHPVMTGGTTGRVMVASDVAGRAGVVVLMGVVIVRTIDPDTGSDGFPDIALVLFGGYALWNLVVAAWALRQAARGPDDRPAVRRFARLLGVGAAIRVLWLLPVTQDPSWSSPALFALLGATVVTIATATMVAGAAAAAPS
jgi:hypothetical protein